MLNHHQQFVQHIKGLSECENVLRVCRSYKTAEKNYAFELNGRLKGGLPLDDLVPDLQHLHSAICAKLGRPHTVYRMTSDHEFSASILEVLEGSFSYSAFMSTSGDVSKLRQFIPKVGRPLLLEIMCLPGIAFAPLDIVSGAEEDEYLLGCGTKFKVIEPPRIDSGYPYCQLNASLMVLKLQVLENPPYVDASKLFTLTD